MLTRLRFIACFILGRPFTGQVSLTLGPNSLLQFFYDGQSTCIRVDPYPPQPPRC